MTTPSGMVLLATHGIALAAYARTGEAPALPDRDDARALAAALDAIVAQNAHLLVLAAEFTADDAVLPAVRRLDVQRHLPSLAAWRDHVLARSARAEPLAAAAAWELTALERACVGDADGAADAKAQAERAAARQVRVPARATYGVRNAQ